MRDVIGFAILFVLSFTGMNMAAAMRIVSAFVMGYSAFVFIFNRKKK